MPKKTELSDFEHLAKERYERFRMGLGQRIERLRLERGWSRLYMFRKFSFYDAHLRRIASGDGMSLETLHRIAVMYEVTVSELLNGVENMDLTTVLVPTKRRVVRKRNTIKPKRKRTAIKAA